MYLNRRVFVMAIYLTPYDAVRGISTHKTGHSVCTNVECLVQLFIISITKTNLYNFDPLKPQLLYSKTGVYKVYIIFLISAQKHRLWVLVLTASARRF